MYNRYLQDQTTTPVTLADVAERIYSRMSNYRDIPMQVGIASMKGIVEHSNLDSEAMKPVLYFVAKFGVEETRPLIESIKRNAKAAGFLPLLSMYERIEGSKDRSGRSVSINAVARLIIGEINNNALAIRENKRILSDLKIVRS